MKAGFHSVNDELIHLEDLTADIVIPLLNKSALTAWEIDDCLLIRFNDGSGQRYTLVVYRRNDLFSLMWDSYNRNDRTKNCCVYSAGDRVSQEKFCTFYQDIVVPNGTFVDLKCAIYAIEEFFENPESPMKKIDWIECEEFDEWPDHVV